MEQRTLIQDIRDGENQMPENGKDCIARSGAHSDSCAHHPPLSEHSTGTRLLITLALNFIIPVVQIIGGIAAHSMALISDATHNFSDFTAILISYIALKIGKKGASLQNTFGYRRAEILAALLNVAILFGASAIIVYGAFHRLQNPEIVSGGLVIGIAAIGVIGNGFSAWLLHRGAKESLNMRGAFLHMMGDMLTSVVVLLNGLILLYKPWYWLDPLLSLLIVIFIVKNCWGILKESTAILMNATPEHLDIQVVQTFLQKFPGISGVHYLHAWSLGSSGVAFSCHVVVEDQPISHTQDLRGKISHALFHEFGIDHPVLQFETSACGNGNLFCEEICTAASPSEPHILGDDRTARTDTAGPRRFALATPRNPFIAKSARFVLPVVIIVVMMFWLTGAFSKDRIEPVKQDVKMRPAAGVPTFSVLAVLTPIISEAAGTIQPEYRMTVSSRISGNILEMRVRAGQRVQKDELIARLDSRDITARSAQAKETLRRAQATRDLAASDYQRDKPLMERAVIPRAEFDQTDMRLRTAEADVQHAREALREADVSLSYAEIRSPATGVVIDKLADVGDLAAPGKALLTLYEENHLWLEANVREQEASLLHIGESYAVRIAATGETMDGNLVEIVPSIDPTSRTVIARITLSRTSGLYPGMFGRLSIPTHQTKKILVPENVIIRIGQLTLVDVVVGDHIKRRAIQTGGRVGDQVEILSGLAGGEKVVCASSQGGTP